MTQENKACRICGSAIYRATPRSTWKHFAQAGDKDWDLVADGHQADPATDPTPDTRPLSDPDGEIFGLWEGLKDRAIGASLEGGGAASPFLMIEEGDRVLVVTDELGEKDQPVWWVTSHRREDWDEGIQDGPHSHATDVPRTGTRQDIEAVAAAIESLEEKVGL